MDGVAHQLDPRYLKLQRRRGWVLSAPGVLAISLLAAPLVLPPSLLVLPGLAVYAALERLVSGESGVRPWSRRSR